MSSTNRHQIVDWATPESHLFFNRKNPEIQNRKMDFAKLPRMAGHIWIPSSGSNSRFGLYGLAKQAFLVSAESVNHFLQVSKNDVWLNILPLHHVGGLSIFARAYLSKSKVFDRSQEQWRAAKFESWVIESRATLTSLVPTQVYDLVQMGQKCPRSLRAIIVGGAALDFDLYVQARKLGYPLLPSFGMTECCSQIATSSMFDLVKKDDLTELPAMLKLPHVDVKVNEDGILAIKSTALFTNFASWDESSRSWDILWRAGDWYTTKDRVLIEAKTDTSTGIKPLGRITEQIKIGGEQVDLRALSEQFLSITNKNNISADHHLFAQADSRLGHEVALCLPIKSFGVADQLVKHFNESVMPLARIKAVYFINELPKTDLQKIKVRELKKQLGLGE